MEPSFRTRQSGSQLEIVDPIERHRCSLDVSNPVSPEPAATSSFQFPVDVAVRVKTDAISLSTLPLAYVRDADGAVLAEVEHSTREALPEDTYSIELSASIKLYVRVESAVTITANEKTRIEFGESTDVLIGARSRHEHPAGTITTTSDPVDMMAAVSALGSALKTKSCERSYPTLRGHPPTIELGDELDIPTGLSPPETGVRIELPPKRRYVFVAAPLAYYLGATIVPGDEPKIVTDTGFEHSLDGVRRFEAEIERVLKQVFFLDCVTRTEGYYQVDLNERRAIEPHVDLDFAALYGSSLSTQLEAYLGVPFAVIEPHLPEWKLSTHVTPVPKSVEVLPFLVNDLGIIKTPRTQSVSGSTLQAAAIDDFMRNDRDTRRSAEATMTETLVQPERTESLEQVWVGDGTPLGASKATAEAFENRLDRTPTEGDIDITVVCNDPKMDAERDVVDEVYGSREELPCDVTVHRNLTVDELRRALTAQTDFLHYIGHIDDDGFQCADGKLDAGTLETVGVDAFLLNACRSYDQGMKLINAGAIGGVVTLSDVINSGAVEIGSTMARLLDRGFPLRSSVTIASDESIVGSQYTVVGDGGLAISQADGGTPYLCEVTPAGEAFEVTMETYPTAERGMGSLVMPHVAENPGYYLSSGSLGTFTMTNSEFAEFLRNDNFPARIDGKLRWSEDIEVENC